MGCASHSAEMSSGLGMGRSFAAAATAPRRTAAPTNVAAPLPGAGSQAGSQRRLLWLVADTNSGSLFSCSVNAQSALGRHPAQASAAHGASTRSEHRQPHF